MALSKISAFNWDKILSKANNADLKKSINILRGKANEIAANAAKYAVAPSAIDFAAYRKKLKFTAEAVDSLQNVYENRSLPSYSASLPPLEEKKRAFMLSIVQSTTEAAKVDLQGLRNQLELFEQIKIKEDTSVGELRDRFPHIAREIEAEINQHEWVKDSR